MANMNERVAEFTAQLRKNVGVQVSRELLHEMLDAAGLTLVPVEDARMPGLLRTDALLAGVAFAQTEGFTNQIDNMSQAVVACFIAGYEAGARGK